MAVVFVRNHQTTGTTTSGTAFSLLTSGAASNVAGNTLIAVIGFDNLSTTTPTVSSIGVPSGETASWSRVGFVDSSSNAGLGGTRCEIWAIQPTTAWGTNTSVTGNLSGSVNCKSTILAEFSGVSLTVRSSGSGTSTVGSPSAVIPTCNSGDLVIGGGCGEGNTVVVGDSDTVNGTWSTVVASGAGPGTNSGIRTCFQYKIVTGTHNQSYDAGFSLGQDSGVVGVSLQPGTNTFNVTSSATCTTTASVLRAISKAVSTTSSTSVAVIKSKAYLLVLSATASTAITVRRLTGKTLQTSASTATSIKRSVQLTAHATATTAVGQVRRVTRSLFGSVATSASTTQQFIRKPFAALVAGTRNAAARLAAHMRRVPHLNTQTGSPAPLVAHMRSASHLETQTGSSSHLDGAP